MNLLVTGGYGFIGWQFIHSIAHLPYVSRIINVDKLTYAATNADTYLYNVDKAISEHWYGTFVRADIADREMMEKIFKAYDIDAVVNFAAETHVDNSITSNTKFVHTNINGTLSLLDCCKSFWGANSRNKFVQVSTDEVFGHLHATDPAFTEASPYQPRNPYSATKAAADHLVMAYCNTHNLNVAITHCSNNYGPGQHYEKLIPKIISNAKQGLKIPVYGDGKQVRDWIYVKDHALGILNVLVGATNPGEHFCIGASNEIRNIDLVTSICKQLDERMPRKSGRSYTEYIEFVADRKGHDARYAIDSSKMQQRFNWKPQMNFETGISKTLDYYINQ